MKKTELKEINLLNDEAFKALFSSIGARKIVSYFLSKLTEIERELPKKIIKEKGKKLDIIIFLFTNFLI